MRQVGQLAAGLAQSLGGKTVDLEEMDLDFEDIFGTEPELLASMSEGALITLVRGPDGIDAPRAVTLAVGLAGMESARPKALALLDAALVSAPSLATPELLALQEALTRAATLH
ncbi:MAG: hypothetical protein VX498_02975 [Myxococcota bacterium]|nr:hypothetical protein [Myxococcota bacterium]